jgi:hypothetical protein
LPKISSAKTGSLRVLSALSSPLTGANSFSSDWAMGMGLMPATTGWVASSKPRITVRVAAQTKEIAILTNAHRKVGPTSAGRPGRPLKAKA